MARTNQGNPPDSKVVDDLHLAFLFDLDGVILHSTAVHIEAWEIYLERQGLRIARVAERMFGKHNDEIVRDFFGDGLTAEQVRRHGSEKERVYRELMAPQLYGRLVPGVLPFLRRYAAVPKAVASNAERANVEFVLSAAGLKEVFAVVVDGMQVALPKPAPDIYLKAASLLGVKPAQCIVFEDSPVGVAAARAAGARVVGLRTTVRDLSGVDCAVDDFCSPELSRWLTRWTVPHPAC
jgi:HAD superfamily hydrolase (TIGR01509 family)